MRKNILILMACLIFFIAVAIWAASLPTEGFFKIANLHDFFDIIGAIATTLAVIIATIGINNWKIQVGATSDHELARKMIVALLKYRNELLDLWQIADVASGENEARHWIRGEDEYSKHIYGNANIRAKNARTELEAISVEAKAIWGGLFETGLIAAFQFENVCANTISNYMFPCKPQPNETDLNEISKISIKSWSDFNDRESLSNETYEEKINALLLPVKIEIEKKLLRA
ncbi:hypothetical protein KTT56_26190 [Pseudomonas viridiflava]|uniref:hypothetical protein n=1 Tax=Pseudomonas viridiflava TaxID=33069 RepID=UPI001C313146|nr:hypothetical protein [Pseudomonas viridiflava]QXG25205.1 hypothetical protein KTT56_26190 [Pseudomonas viridiflava]